MSTSKYVDKPDYVSEEEWMWSFGLQKYFTKTECEAIACWEEDNHKLAREVVAKTEEKRLADKKKKDAEWTAQCFKRGNPGLTKKKGK